MIRYKVRVINNPESRQSIKFHDLLIKYSTGYFIPLQLNEGEYLPLEILEADDIKKSLIVGSLGKYIRNGKVVVEDDAPPPPPVQIAPPVVPVTVEPLKEKEVIKPIEEPPTKQVQDLKPEEKPLTNFDEVKSKADYNRLAYFLKLRFVRETQDLELLKTISSSTDASLQVKNLIQFRLQQK